MLRGMLVVYDAMSTFCCISGFVLSKKYENNKKSFARDVRAANTGERSTFSPANIYGISRL